MQEKKTEKLVKFFLAQAIIIPAGIFALVGADQLIIDSSNTPYVAALLTYAFLPAFVIALAREVKAIPKAVKVEVEVEEEADLNSSVRNSRPLTERCIEL